MFSGGNLSVGYKECLARVTAMPGPRIEWNEFSGRLMQLSHRVRSLTPVVAYATRTGVERGAFAVNAGRVVDREGKKAERARNPSKYRADKVNKAINGVFVDPVVEKVRPHKTRKKGFTTRTGKTKAGLHTTVRNDATAFESWAAGGDLPKVVALASDNEHDEYLVDFGATLPGLVHAHCNFNVAMSALADKTAAKNFVIKNFHHYVEFVRCVGQGIAPSEECAQKYIECSSCALRWPEAAAAIAKLAEDRIASHNAASARLKGPGVMVGTVKDSVLVPTVNLVNDTKGVFHAAGMGLAGAPVVDGAFLGTSGLVVGTLELFQSQLEQDIYWNERQACKLRVRGVQAAESAHRPADDTDQKLYKAVKSYWLGKGKSAKREERIALGRGANGFLRGGVGGAALGVTVAGGAACFPVLAAVGAGFILGYHGMMAYRQEQRRLDRHKEKRDQQDGAAQCIQFPQGDALERAFRDGASVRYGAGDFVGDGYAGEHEKELEGGFNAALAVEVMARRIHEAYLHPSDQGIARKTNSSFRILSALGFAADHRIAMDVRVRGALARGNPAEALKAIKESICSVTQLPGIFEANYHAGMYEEVFRGCLHDMGDPQDVDAGALADRLFMEKQLPKREFSTAVAALRTAMLHPLHKDSKGPDGIFQKMVEFDTDLASIGRNGDPPHLSTVAGDLLRSWQEGAPSFDKSSVLPKANARVVALLGQAASLPGRPLYHGVRQAVDQITLGMEPRRDSKLHRRWLLDLNLLLCSTDLTPAQRQVARMLRAELRAITEPSQSREARDIWGTLLQDDRAKLDDGDFRRAWLNIDGLLAQMGGQDGETWETQLSRLASSLGDSMPPPERVGYYTDLVLAMDAILESDMRLEGAERAFFESLQRELTRLADAAQRTSQVELEAGEVQRDPTDFLYLDLAAATARVARFLNAVANLRGDSWSDQLEDFVYGKKKLAAQIRSRFYGRLVADLVTIRESGRSVGDGPKFTEELLWTLRALERDATTESVMEMAPKADGKQKA